MALPLLNLPLIPDFQYTLYGIANCDQVKKARAWLAQRHLSVPFHDFRKDGLTRAHLERWLQQIAWQSLLNRKGTTWRALADDRKAAIVDDDSAMALMLASPAVIKRPVLTTPTALVVGFSDDLYQPLFKE